MSIFRDIFKIIIIFSIISTTNAGKKIKSELCEPYFVSLKVEKANSHIGPSFKYKNVAKYQQRWVPLLVIAIYDTWRQVKDMNNGVGWLKQSQLSTKRYLMVKHQRCILFKEQNTESKKIAILRKGVIMKLISLKNNWCQVTVIINGKPKCTGYVQRQYVYGLLDNETEL